MASDPVKFIGRIDCPVCGEDLPVRQNGRDTLNISCICCGISSYAKGGTESHSMISGWLRDKKPDKPKVPVASVATGVASKEDTPAAVPAKPSQVPAQAIAASIKRGFDLGAL